MRESREAEERQEREREEREMREREKNRDSCEGEGQMRGPGEKEEMYRGEEAEEQERVEDNCEDGGAESTSSTGKRVAKTISFSFSSVDEERLVAFFREHECFYN